MKTYDAMQSKSKYIKSDIYCALKRRFVDMNKQQLANKIWESANKMRSKIEANEYKDYILGFIFYKYLSDREISEMKKEGMEEEDIKALSEDDKDTMEYVRDRIGYFIAYHDLFSTWLEMGSDFNISNVHDALSAFERLISPRYRDVFDGIFETLQTGLSKLGDSAASQKKSVSELLYLIKDIPMDGKQDYDVLGFIYEYLISMFAANAGKKAGEFYTPHEVSILMSEIVASHLKDRETIDIYDPTSGSGSLLINIGKSAAKHIGNPNKIKYYAQELKQNTYNLTRMNLVMRGIMPDNIMTRNADTLENDWPYFDENDPIGTYEPLYVDAVVSNPPYSQNWDPTGKDADPRYARFGLAPKGKADYAFLLHDLFHIKPDGIMTIVLPHGVLFRGGEEGQIRKNLIENNHIDTIIGLPANIFFGTGIPTIIMVLKQKRENTDVLIIDASKDFAKEGKNNKLRACDIKRIADTVENRISITKYSKVVDREEIRTNDYNLNIPRYVDSSEAAEGWDIYASMFGGIPKKEINALNKYWTAFPSLCEALFTDPESEYSHIKDEDIKAAIYNNSDIKSFDSSFKAAFSDFKDYLAEELLANCETVNVSAEENKISNDIFRRLENISLVDKYAAYQILDDEWTKIAVDLEIIQTEGPAAVRRVDPHMILKKKGNKEEEIQDGWIGRIIPFELAQHELLADQTESLEKKKERLGNISSEYDEILEALSEDDKETYSNILNDDNTSFVNSEISKTAKALLKGTKRAFYEEDSAERKIINVNDLISEEKELKKSIKKEEADLHMLTKKTIEELSDSNADMLLKKKWIYPVTEKLEKIPEQIISELVSAVQTLAGKYSVTLADIEKETRDTEASLCSMIDELGGSEFDIAGLAELKSLLGGN